MWIGIVWVGLITGVVTLLALDIRLPGGLIDGHGDLVEARSMAFTTLVLAQLFNTFNARSDRVSAFHKMFTNGYLWAAIALSLVLQVAVVELPFLNEAFGTEPLSASDWAICIGLASCVLWAAEAKKLLGRARRHAAAAAP
jgi:magnesium-transporting ATPase (P-type)